MSITLAIAIALAAWAPAGLHAQALDDDAGIDADGGTEGDAGDGHGGIACSCEIREDRGEEGVVHTCTGSFDADVCTDFSCERSRVLSRPCPTAEIDLCCDMGARGMFTNLYVDCSYPNCEGGFRAQCTDYGGVVFSGSCGGQSDDDSGSGTADPADKRKRFCAVSAPGSDQSSDSLPLLGCLGLGAALWARRRRDRRQL